MVAQIMARGCKGDEAGSKLFTDTFNKVFALEQAKLINAPQISVSTPVLWTVSSWNGA